jgi:hypothetical protein
MSATEILHRDRERKRKRDEARKRKRARRLQRIAELREHWAKFPIPELLDETAACLFLGGSKPLDGSTLWRGVKEGRYSRPIYVSAQTVRWQRTDLQSDLDRMVAERDGEGATAA